MMNTGSIEKLKTMGDEERFLKNICPFCGSNLYRVVLQSPDHLFAQRGVFQALECRDCLGWFTDGSRFKNIDEFYLKSYPHEYYEIASGGRKGDAGSNPMIREVLLKNIWEKPTEVIICDVGCGNGGFLNYLREKGFQVFGVEKSKIACEYSEKEYGIKVFNGTIEDLPISQSFDAIVMVGTIEHLLNPIRTISVLRKHLKPKGLFIFDFPDINSLEFKLAGSRWWALDLPRHTIHFTRKSAQRVIEAGGFQLIQSISIPKTWFHPGFLTPPVRDGFKRWSIQGILIQCVSVILLIIRAKPHHIYICRSKG